jgi:predicted phosphodiesterase
MASMSPILNYNGEVFLCHGTPRNDASFWFDWVEMDGAVRPSTIQDIEAGADGIDASLILCAHTHIPRVVPLRDGRTIVNPGSVGLPG